MTVKKTIESNKTLIKACHRQVAKTQSSEPINNSSTSELVFHNSLKSDKSRKHPKDKFHSPGPIQFVYDQEDECAKTIAQATSASDEAVINHHEYRNYECKNYDCCLNIVAALDWEGFSCQNCNGEINQKLLWRAQGECTKDESIKLICELPDLRQRKIEAKTSTDAQEQGLRLVVNNTVKKI